MAAEVATAAINSNDNVGTHAYCRLATENSSHCWKSRTTANKIIVSLLMVRIYSQ